MRHLCTSPNDMRHTHKNRARHGCPGNTSWGMVLVPKNTPLNKKWRNQRTPRHKYLRRYLHHVEEDLNQNRRQKVVNMGGFTFVQGGGLDIQIWQKLHI